MANYPTQGDIRRILQDLPADLKELKQLNYLKDVKEVLDISMTEVTVAVNSSWISHIRYVYGTKEATMYVPRGKGEYTFPEISQRTFWEWAQASSAGKYYNKYIRGLHYQRLLFKIARALASAKKAIARFLRKG